MPGGQYAGHNLSLETIVAFFRKYMTIRVQTRWARLKAANPPAGGAANPSPLIKRNLGGRGARVLRLDWRGAVAIFGVLSPVDACRRLSGWCVTRQGLRCRSSLGEGAASAAAALVRILQAGAGPKGASSMAQPFEYSAIADCGRSFDTFSVGDPRANF